MAEPEFSELGMGKRYVPGLMVRAWVLAGWMGAGYGTFLTVAALRSDPGAELTGQWVAQPAFKAAMALLLALAAAAHPIARERRWLAPALVFSAVGDWLLAIPWWRLSFVLGLGAFLLAHVCFLGALTPLTRGAARSWPRLVAVVAMCVGCVALLTWFWPHLGPDKLTIPVTGYMMVLCAMVCAALLARLPTLWTAAGAVCFALSDALIGTGKFVLGNEALAVSIWWSYALAMILITAGFFFGRAAAEPDQAGRMA